MLFDDILAFKLVETSGSEKSINPKYFIYSSGCVGLTCWILYASIEFYDFFPYNNMAIIGSFREITQNDFCNITNFKILIILVHQHEGSFQCLVSSLISSFLTLKHLYSIP